MPDLPWKVSLRYLRWLLAHAGADFREHVLFGSVVAHMLGVEMPRPCGDIDVFVTPAVWGRLLAYTKDGSGSVLTPRIGDPPFLEFPLAVADEEPDGPPIHVFYDWSSRDAWLRPEECFAEAEEVRGWRCIPLSLLMRHKSLAEQTTPDPEAQAKHKDDMAVLALASARLAS